MMAVAMTAVTVSTMSMTAMAVSAVTMAVAMAVSATMSMTMTMTMAVSVAMAGSVREDMADGVAYGMTDRTVMMMLDLNGSGFNGDHSRRQWSRDACRNAKRTTKDDNCSSEKFCSKQHGGSKKVRGLERLLRFPREQTICSDGFNVERVLPLECELHHKACVVRETDSRGADFVNPRLLL